MVSELIEKLQAGNFTAALLQVYSSEGMARINAIENRIKILETQKNILSEQIAKMETQLNELITHASVSD